jgi:hypothetical protein
MTLYVIAFSYFFHRISRVFAQAFVIYIFRFFALDFLKIIFILCDIQTLKRECYNTNISDHLSPADNCRVDCLAGNRRVDTSPGPPLLNRRTHSPSITYIYKG